MGDAVKIQLTGQQMAALAQLELCIHTLGGAANGCSGLNAQALAAALVVCVKTLEKAHEEFVQASQRTVSIAAPADIQAVLHDGVKT